MNEKSQRKAIKDTLKQIRQQLKLHITFNRALDDSLTFLCSFNLVRLAANVKKELFWINRKQQLFVNHNTPFHKVTFKLNQFLPLQRILFLESANSVSRSTTCKAVDDDNLKTKRYSGIYPKSPIIPWMVILFNFINAKKLA